MSNFTDKQELTFQIVKNATIIPHYLKNGKDYSGIFNSPGQIINHSLIFLENLKAKIKIFTRPRLQDLVNYTFIMIAKSKQIQQTEHFVPQTKIREKTKQFGASLYMIHSYREIIDILNSNED